jgi:hypothetical protein
MRRAALLAVVMSAVLAASARAADVSWSPFGTVGTDGWYVSDVWINWTLTNISPPLQQGCNPTHFVTDSPGSTATCTATDASGATSKTTTQIKIDRTPPVARATPERPVDTGSFYNHPVTVAWSATDATSGVASCSSIPYAGPDGTAVSLAGTCRDVAGNVSAPVAFVFNYDATPPVVARVAAGIGKKTANLAWEVSGATTIVLVRASARAPSRQRVVFQGAATSFIDRGLITGRHYTYIVRAIDQAGNVATRSINVTPGSASRDRLLAPRANAQLRRPPLLRWRKVKRASYYNVQVFRNGRKILSAWPTKPHYQLRRSWRYQGHRHRLADATYRWYLWAGYGKRSARHYGRLLGQRSFKVR